MTDFDWLERRTLRSIDQLKLWPENPRLDPDEQHVRIADFVSDLIADSGEKDSFLALINSIATNGYIPSDPIVVWQDEDSGKFYVAEGNRRILALKLLRNPEKAPKSIRALVRQKSHLIDRNDIAKVRVSVAPSFESCEWYINQRHATSTLQKPWSRLQQQRWIAELYDKYDGNIETLQAITGFRKSQLDYTLRILKLRDMAMKDVVLQRLTNFEQDKVKSHRIPMSILERWFYNLRVREKWGIEFVDDDVQIKSVRSSFLFAYTAFIKLVIHRDDPNVELRINTRSIDKQVEEILEKLPTVTFDENEASEAEKTQHGTDLGELLNIKPVTEEPNNQEASPTKPVILNKNPDRNQLVVTTGVLKTSNYKINGLYNEFKKLPIGKYQNCTAASLRVFLDLAITEFFNSEDCIGDVQKKFNNKPYRDIQLKQRLEFLKQQKLTPKSDALKIVQKLLNKDNEFSLDTLNNYIHGSHTHHTNKKFLNGFWDFLFPLFEVILDIKE